MPDICQNFIISMDGTTYEGRGFDNKGEKYRGSSIDDALLIGIMGIRPFGRPPPKETELAKKHLIEYGVKKGKIDSDYKEYNNRVSVQ